MPLLLLRGRRELLLLRLRWQRPNGQLRRLLLRLLDRRPRLLRLLLELGLLQERRGLLLLRLRWQRPNGRLRRLLLLRLPRRLLLLLPLLLPGEVRARVGSRSDCGGSVAGHGHNAIRAGRCNRCSIHATLLVHWSLDCCTVGIISSNMLPGASRISITLTGRTLNCITLMLSAALQFQTLRIRHRLILVHLAGHNLRCLIGRVGRGGGVLLPLPSRLTRVSRNPV